MSIIPLFLPFYFSDLHYGDKMERIQNGSFIQFLSSCRFVMFVIFVMNANITNISHSVFAMGESLQEKDEERPLPFRSISDAFDEPEAPEGSLIERIVSHVPSVKIPEADGYSVDEAGILSLPTSSPLHPWSWSMNSRLFTTVMYAVTTSTVQMSITYVTADISQVAEKYNVGTEVASVAFSVMILGNIIGAIVLSPLSEAYGRKLSVFGSNFMCGCIVCVTANVDSIAAFTVFRFIAGIFAGAPLSIGAGAMSDVWEPKVRIAAMALYGTMIVVGSAVSPILASLLVTNDPGYGDRWGAWLMGILQISWSLFSYITVKESFVPGIERDVARDVRVSLDKWNVHGRLEKWRFTPREFLLNQIMRPVWLFFTPTMLCYNTLSSFVYGLFFLLISTNSMNFQKVHHFPATTSHCTFLAILAGFICGGVILVGFGFNMAQIAKKIRGPPPPEALLRPMMIGVFFLPAGCFMYGWSLYPHVHWIVPCVGLGLVGAGFALVFVVSLAYIVQCYSTPRASYAASAIAANMVLRSGMGGGFPLFATQMYQNLGVHWASSLLGFLLALAIPIPFLFYILGPRIRAGDIFRKELESL